MNTDRIDDETLAGHFLLAGIDRRFAEQRDLGEACEFRGMLQPGDQAEIERRLKAQAETTDLPGPGIVGPAD